MTSTRWQAERSDADAHAYVRRFRRLAESGADSDGEARFVDALLGRGSSVLDAGCGTGRVGAALATRGHHVTAVDLDPVLLDEARSVPQLEVHEADLASLALDRRFDAIVAAGNVMVYLAPGTEQAVLQRFRDHLVDGGVLVTGFATDREYTPAQFRSDLTATGFTIDHVFATWDVRPWAETADWMVTVARAPAPLSISS